MENKKLKMIRKKCPYCDKFFTGVSENQVMYQYEIHVGSKHPEKVEYDEDNNVEEEENCKENIKQ